jgi:hypothetical protein
MRNGWNACWSDFFRASKLSNARSGIFPLHRLVVRRSTNYAVSLGNVLF